MIANLQVTPEEWHLLHEGLMSLLWRYGLDNDKRDDAKSASINQLIVKLRDAKASCFAPRDGVY